VLSVRADLSRLRSAVERWQAAVQRARQLRSLAQQRRRRRLAQALLCWRGAVRDKAAGRLQLLRALVWHVRRVAASALRSWLLQAAAGALRAEASGRKMGRLRLLQCLRVSAPAAAAAAARILQRPGPPWSAARQLPGRRLLRR
jgi:hypothetical protein